MPAGCLEFEYVERITVDFSSLRAAEMEAWREPRGWDPEEARLMDPLQHFPTPSMGALSTDFHYYLLNCY